MHLQQKNWHHHLLTCQVKFLTFFTETIYQATAESQYTVISNDWYLAEQDQTFCPSLVRHLPPFPEFSRLPSRALSTFKTTETMYVAQLAKD